MKNAPEVINDVISFINEKEMWQGTATELLEILDKKDITPQYLTKVLNEYSKTILLDNKISFTTSRTMTMMTLNLYSVGIVIERSPDGKSGTPTLVKSVVLSRFD